MELKLKNAFFQMPVIAVPTKQSKSSVAPEDGFFSKAMLTSLAGGGETESASTVVMRKCSLCGYHTNLRLETK